MSAPAGLRGRPAALLAWTLWALAAALIALAALFQALNWAAGTRSPLLASLGTLLLTIAVLAFPTVGALVAVRRPAHPVGWLFCVMGLGFGFGLAGWGYALYTLFTAPGVLPGGAVLAWVATWTRVPLSTSFLLFLLVFPDGRLPSPRWRPVAWLAVAELVVMPVAVALQPGPLEFNRLLIFSSVANPFGVRGPAGDVLRLVTTVGWAALQVLFLAAVSAFVVRLRRARGDERQQLKWLAYAGAVILSCAALYYTAYAAIGPSVLVSPVGQALGSIVILALAGLPLAVGNAVLKYRLYDIDVLINRTLVYGALTAGLLLACVGSVVLLQFLLRPLTRGSELAVAGSTLAAAALFQPLRRRIQRAVDRRFYRERVDFRRAFAAFAQEVRTLVELPELLRALAERTTALLHVEYGAVFLRDAAGAFHLAAERNRPPLVGGTIEADAAGLDRLGAGVPLPRPKGDAFRLLVPLLAPETAGQGAAARARLIGVLALGPRLSDQDYSREDQDLLAGLADQAGTAIYGARLSRERRAEAERLAERERQLAAYRESPAGRAAALAQALAARPDTALVELHRLAQRAGRDADEARVLAHLPAALTQVGTAPLAALAEGMHYLFAGQLAPEVLPAGLRAVLDQLERPAAQSWVGAAEAVALYRLCRQALEARSPAEVAQILPALEAQVTHGAAAQAGAAAPAGAGRAASIPAGAPLADLARVISQLAGAAERFQACERVDSAPDKLAYLAGAVERLGRVDRVARAELGGADRAVAQRIVEGWLAIATGAMGDLQTRGQLVCRLATRRVWQREVVTLTWSVRNVGRGAARDLAAGLAPAPDYAVLDEPVRVVRLEPGEETEVELRLRPHVERFRAQLVVRYADPRGPDQVEYGADAVSLLSAAGPFQVIPNPYVVGTPLQPGSPLFVGRRDVVAFIEEHLAAAHRNNLVLVGQRRTGKTSLLKQLPLRLGDAYVPVYLDGQAMGLDPGLPNFLLAVSTEIAYALEDRGFAVEPPALTAFDGSPALTFERQFLARVRAAIGARQLLLLLDEFEELEAAVRRGILPDSVFGWLRHLIQHTPQLSVILCGTHRLEELSADHGQALFNLSLYRHVGFLEQPEALRLLQEPVAPFGLRYDDLALEKVWRLTAGHPYFLQLLAHGLVRRHNRTRQSCVTVADVNAALDEILAAGEAHLVYLWTDSTPDERLVLAALSGAMPLTGRATAAQVVDLLAGRGITLGRRATAEALHHLSLRDILAAAGDGAGAPGAPAGMYRWKLGVLGQWVEQYRPLSRVVEEAQA